MTELGITQVQESDEGNEGDDMQDLRKLAKNCIAKVRALVLKSKTSEPERKVADKHLGEVYELFVQQALELAGSKRGI